MEQNKYPHITDPDIQAYCNKYSTSVPEYIQHLGRLTEPIGNTQMLSGNFLGQFLSIISLMLAPKNILEVGSFTGYGALCLQRGLQPDGQIITLEKNKELKGFYLQVEGPDFSNIHQMIGDAAEIIDGLNQTFDLVFIDAAKRQYISYYDLILPKLRKGGVILADNVLWKGKVVTDFNDNLGEGLDAFNQHVFKDERVENIILPIDDGVNLIFKK